MGDIVELKPKLPDENDDRFIEDLTRYTEKILDQQDIKSRHKLSDADLEKLAGNDKIIAAVRECRLRRRQVGALKRERAQMHVEAAPDILNGIMRDPAQSARQRIESAKTLDAMAAEKSAEAADRDRFVIHIDLSGGGGDVLHFDMPLKPIEPIDDSNKPVRVIDDDEVKIPSPVAITAKVKKDDSSGEPLATIPDEMIHRWGDGYERVTSAELFTRILRKPPDPQNAALGLRLAQVMKGLGWWPRRFRVHGKQVRGYVRRISCEPVRKHSAIVQ